MREAGSSSGVITGGSDGRQESPPRSYVYPGNLEVLDNGGTLVTVLGSCVSVCLWDPVTACGGLNHYLLPFGAGEGRAALRFGNLATPVLIERLEELTGAGRRSRFVAKIFGGASVLEAFRSGVGLCEKNIKVARETLAEAGIAIIAEDVGGRFGRKLLFDTRSGIASVKRLKGSQ